MAPFIDSGTPLVDGSTWQAALLARVSETMKSVLNEFGINVQIIFAPTDAKVSYEKDAVTIQCEQHDVSDPKNGIYKMGVALDVRNIIAANNPAGYVYGLYVEIGCKPGSDGELNGVEIGGNNQGPKGAAYGTWGAKGLLTFVAGEYEGCNNLTHAIAFAPGTAKFEDGVIIFERAALIPGAPVMRLIDNATGKDIFQVMEDGTVRYTKLEQIV